MTDMVYTSHGAMTPEDLAEVRADYDLDCADGICGPRCCGADVETCPAMVDEFATECGNAVPCPWHSW